MRERLFLQITVSIACLIPLIAGFWGMFIIDGKEIDAVSHFRYLSGLLFAIGFSFLGTIRKIETYKSRFRLLTFIVFIGGLARLYGLINDGIPSYAMRFGLVMELVITPLLCLWQDRVARKFGY